MSEWIPIKFREIIDDEERKEAAERYGVCPEDIKYAFDCPLPDDGQQVLITTRWGDITLTYFCEDEYGLYFEDYEDEGDVIAWMCLPEPYDIGGSK